MAFFGVNFILQKFCLCKKNDKYEVCAAPCFKVLHLRWLWLRSPLLPGRTTGNIHKISNQCYRNVFSNFFSGGLLWPSPTHSDALQSAQRSALHITLLFLTGVKKLQTQTFQWDICLFLGRQANVTWVGPVHRVIRASPRPTSFWLDVSRNSHALVSYFQLLQ